MIVEVVLITVIFLVFCREVWLEIRLEKLKKKIEKEEHKRFFRGLGRAFGGD